MKVQILIDNPDSWIIPYAKELRETLNEWGHDCMIIHDHSKVSEGDILCLLSCERIFKKLNLNKHNLVVHESALPHGKGWSPLSWQVLEGSNRIPVTLFEAADKVDDGVIYDQKIINLDGSELLPDIKHKQGKITRQIILEFIKRYPDVEGQEQKGESTFYPRRTPEDSEIDISKTIEDNFNLLRVCDNERYPAFFKYKGKKYILKIYSDL